MEQENIILIDSTKKCDFFINFKELFLYLKNKEKNITSLEEGIITTVDKDNKEEIFNFAILKKEETKNDFLISINDYREELRENIKSILRMGIKINKEETDKISKSFKFLDENKK